MQETEYEQWRAQAVREILDETGSSMVEKRLPINIEGEPQERKESGKAQSKCRQRRGRTRTGQRASADQRGDDTANTGGISCLGSVYLLK